MDYENDIKAAAVVMCTGRGRFRLRTLAIKAAAGRAAEINQDLPPAFETTPLRTVLGRSGHAGDTRPSPGFRRLRGGLAMNEFCDAGDSAREQQHDSGSRFRNGLSISGHREGIQCRCQRAAKCRVQYLNGRYEGRSGRRRSRPYGKRSEPKHFPPSVLRSP